MKIKIFKNTIIFLLVVLSLVQTGLIWFENGSVYDALLALGRNQGYKPSQTELSALSVPTRILTGISENCFASSYTALSESPGKKTLDVLMKGLFDNGEYIRSLEISKNQIFCSSNIIYQYEFGIPSDVLMQCFSSKSSAMLSRIGDIEFIAAAGTADGLGVNLYFLPHGSGIWHEYKIDGSNYAEHVNNSIANIDSQLYYELLPSSDFKDGTLIPKWDGEEFYYYNVDMFNPYAEDDSKPMTVVQKRVSVFIDNPSALIPDIRNDIFTFSNNQSVIKFNPNDLLEYSNYATKQSNVTNSFLSSYSTALSMLRRDDTLLNDFYLAEYSHNSVDGSWNFGFDFSINDMPLFFSKDVSNELGINHIIEITVTDDTVVKYKRYISVFEIDESFSSIATLGFDMTAGPDISDIMLGYKIDKGRQLSLHWQMSISGKTYVEPLQ